MTYVKDLLSDQLLANANDRSWYEPFSLAVAQLSEEQAHWKPTHEVNSIAEIVQHLLYWNKTWQMRYIANDIHAVPSIGDNNKSFELGDALPFKEMKATLLSTLLNWQELLTESQLQDSVQGFSEDVHWWQVIGNVTTHNAYHVGQIIVLRKLQGSWHSHHVW